MKKILIMQNINKNYSLLIHYSMVGLYFHIINISYGKIIRIVKIYFISSIYQYINITLFK